LLNVDWIDRLEEDAWNVIVDELVWHLREGRMPAAIRKHSTPRAGVEFCFEAARSAFFPIDESILEDHWKQAVIIIGGHTQLGNLRTYDT
jgi:hypothetical protein